MRIFRDRHDAGRQLAGQLSRYSGIPDLLVLALPRGGVPVAFEVALALQAELDVFLVRKLGVPGRSELAMGAIASDGVRVLNEDVIRALRIDDAAVEHVTEAERAELERRERAYRGDRPRPQVHRRSVILVDDGLATGATMRAAVAALRKQDPARLVVGVPVAPPEACEGMASLVDDIVCVATPHSFYGVGRWYEDFSQTTDEEVRDLLARSTSGTPSLDAGPAPGPHDMFPS